MKYIVEDDINFYEKLLQSLDDDSDDEELICKISGLPMDKYSVKLECNHKFNYDALYKEICKQKFDFKTYDVYSLSKKDQLKMRELKVDYFIKCPYCRKVQYNILPYYEELKLDEIYGINSLNDKLRNRLFVNEYTYYGNIFKKGLTCNECSNKKICLSLYVACIPNTNLCYCTFHYRSGLKKYKLNEKQKKIDEKKKQKEDILIARKKLFEEKNKLRAEKGLPPLKCLPRLKNVIENVVSPGQPIGQYIPDSEVVINNSQVINNSELGCKMILKTGPNKGKICGCKKIFKDNLCKRHSSNIIK